MEIAHEKIGEVLVMTVGGRIDMQFADEFQAALLERIAAGERKIVLDCGGVDYVNSAGLKVFLLAAKKLEPQGGRVIPCALASNVRTVFELTGFDKIFDLKDTRAEALAALGA